MNREAVISGRASPLILMVVALSGALSCAAGPPEASSDCAVKIDGYVGPCPLGALPAFFDDFRYASGQTTGDVAHAPDGDMFGENAWMTIEGRETTRGWYRFNRGNLSVPGRIDFHDGVMHLMIPAGTSAEDFVRSMMLHTGATFESGTYHYRLRLSRLWPGQQLRQSAWAISPELFIFEREEGNVRERYSYWSEIDFENQNHFQGSRESGRFVPDFISHLNVGTHYGLLERNPGYPLSLSEDGPVAHYVGRGALVREGFAREAHIEAAPRIDDWSEVWLDLLVHVDPHTRETVYSMRPVQYDERLSSAAERSVRIGDSFYPRRPMHMAFSLHWIEPEGYLENDLWMDVDWVYHSPEPGLTFDDVLIQVEHLRSRGYSRVNTTGGPTFRNHDVSLEAAIEGPTNVECHEAHTWRLIVNRAGFVHATFRYRGVDQQGRPEPWTYVVDFDATIRPRMGVAHIDFIASVTDQWRRAGIQVDAETGWEYPNPANVSSTVHRRVEVTCGR